MPYNPEIGGNNDINKNHFNIFNFLTLFFYGECFSIDMSFVIKRSESQVFKAKRNAALVR